MPNDELIRLIVEDMNSRFAGWTKLQVAARQELMDFIIEQNAQLWMALFALVDVLDERGSLTREEFEEKQAARAASWEVEKALEPSLAALYARLRAQSRPPRGDPAEGS